MLRPLFPAFPQPYRAVNFGKNVNTLSGVEIEILGIVRMTDLQKELLDYGAL
jgi:hypothetical protein